MGVMTVTSTKPVHISIFSTKPMYIITLAIDNFVELLLEIQVHDEIHEFIYT